MRITNVFQKLCVSFSVTLGFSTMEARLKKVRKLNCSILGWKCLITDHEKDRKRGTKN